MRLDLSLCKDGSIGLRYSWFAGRTGEIGMETTRANGETPDTDDLNLLDRYWRAANYLSVGQIYLLDNPLLKEPLRREHIKPRLLGHWGTTPGLNFIYAHLNLA